MEFAFLSSFYLQLSQSMIKYFFSAKVTLLKLFMHRQIYKWSQLYQYSYLHKNLLNLFFGGELKCILYFCLQVDILYEKLH